MIKLLHRELSHFRSLSSKAQLLLVSFFLKGMADPVAKVFVNAYIWQSNTDPMSVLFYNIGDFISIPIMFYLNGFFLRKIKAKYLFFLGAMGIGVSCMFVIFYTWFNPIAYIFYGLIYGIWHGLYWANRNLLTLQETESKTRNYFIGISFTGNFITSIIVPLIIGWFITLGMHFNLISLKVSYQISMGIAFIMLFLSGLVLLKSDFNKEQIVVQMQLKHVTYQWILVRLLMMGMGIAEATTFFLPTVLILMNIGKEGILGTITALTSLISALGMYLFGRFADVHHRKGVFIINMILAIISSLILAFYHNQIGIIIYVCLNAFTIMMAWLAAEPMILDIIDQEHVIGANEKYAFIFDRELFLNIGRMLTYLVCLVFYYFWGVGVAFLFLPLLAWLVLLGISGIVIPRVK
ncbi:MAG: MFS transporter [bacterium]|nr:MFS transporter [bacterium]